MPIIRKELTVKNKQGLHARPAAIFVQTANKFDARITVRYHNEEINGKSIMGILMLGAEKDSLIVVEADGSDAEAALAELEKLISSEEEL